MVLPQPPDKSNNIIIGTLKGNSIKGKRVELAELINVTQMDIIIFSETKLPPKKKQKDLNT